MELKHKECFCPATVNCWDLQAVSKYVREVAEFVNLYSIYRGTNRFISLVHTFEILYKRPEVLEMGFTMPDISSLKKWNETTPVLSASALEEYAKTNNNLDSVMLKAANWSREVDSNIAHIVRNIRPFINAKEAIIALSQFADIVIVSATPFEALNRELVACGIVPYVRFLASQEVGTKAECIKYAMEGKYDPDHVLKIGDALGDLKAANMNGALFHPIIPKKEKESWKMVATVSAEHFKNLNYRGQYMDNLISEFRAVLLDKPLWKEVE
ncbi:MAG: HAD family hydrolase [Sphaerochaetaceae bacterium]|nr:HAD family hydrolase [Sphaerochaetaceae bacterium]